PAATPAASKPAPAAPETQLAARPPAAVTPSAPAAGVAVSVNFPTSASDLSDRAKAELGKLAERLKQNQELRLQLIAYAAGTEAEASLARRLSLTRALAVRGYLFDQGVGASRMDVRALGNKLEGGGSADRVDLVVVGK
ncbi:MAG TPA: OmpA family protein, partial [Thermoanaerobaculia bacterium]|nr:OmpA family protein [Thermoanaerobaculia bacterium]